MLQQPGGIRCELRCGAPILHQWSTGSSGAGVVRPAQKVGYLVHALPRAKCGEMRDRVEGITGGVSLRLETI